LYTVEWGYFVHHFEFLPILSFNFKLENYFLIQTGPSCPPLPDSEIQFQKFLLHVLLSAIEWINKVAPWLGLLCSPHSLP